MYRNIKVTMSCLLLSLFLFSCASRSGLDLNKLAHSPYERDFLYLADELRSNHPGLTESPLPAMSLDKYDSLVETTFLNLKNVTNDREYYFALSTFMAQFQDGHSGVFFRPYSDKFLPVSFSWIGQDLYVTKNLKPEYGDLLGARVINFGGKNSLEIEELILSFLPTDFNSVQSHRKELFGSNFFLLAYDFYDHFNLVENDQLDIGFEQNGKAFNRSLSYYSKDELFGELPFAQARNSITENRFETHWTVLDEYSTLYFQVGNSVISESILEELVLHMIEKKLENLVIDVRNCGGGLGGESMMALFKYFVESSGEYYMYRGYRRDGDEVGLVTNEKGTIFIEADPITNDSDINLYILTNGFTFSSASTFVMFVRDNGIGTIIGEPCGNTDLRYGHKTNIDLPETGMKVFYSTAIWNSAVNRSKVPGLINPHIPVEQTIENYLNETDAVWDKYLGIIN